MSRSRHDSSKRLALTMAERMTSLRRARDLTLEEVAERAGMSKSHVWETENGKANNPTIDTALRLARVFGCSLDYLIGVDSKTADLHPEAMRIACEVDALLRKPKRRG